MVRKPLNTMSQRELHARPLLRLNYQKLQFKYVPVENRLADAGEEAIKHLPQLVIGPILNRLTTVKSMTCGVSKAYKIVLRKPPKRRLRWQISCKKKLKALKGELKKQTIYCDNI